MRKLIEQKPESLIVCDNPKCDYTESYSKDKVQTRAFINKPCPKCGENLLTMQDYIQYLKVLRVVDFINRWFSWITIFYSKKKMEKVKSFSVHTHNGVTITENKD